MLDRARGAGRRAHSFLGGLLDEESGNAHDEEVADRRFLAVRLPARRHLGLLVAQRRVEWAEEPLRDIVVADRGRQQREHAGVDAHLGAELGAVEALGRHGPVARNVEVVDGDVSGGEVHHKEVRVLAHRAAPVRARHRGHHAVRLLVRQRHLDAEVVQHVYHGVARERWERLLANGLLRRRQLAHRLDEVVLARDDRLLLRLAAEPPSAPVARRAPAAWPRGAAARALCRRGRGDEQSHASSAKLSELRQENAFSLFHMGHSRRTSLTVPSITTRSEKPHFCRFTMYARQCSAPRRAASATGLRAGTRNRGAHVSGSVSFFGGK